MEKTKNTRLIGWTLLLFISFIYFFANLQKVLVPGATFNELQQAFDVDAAQITRLGAAFMYVYAFMQLATGLLADRYSGARIIAVGGILFCFGSLLSSLDNSLNLLLGSRILTAFGGSIVYLCAIKEISVFIPQSLPTFIGILTIIGYSGSIVGTSPFIAGVQRFGYYKMMLWAGICATIAYALYLLVYTVAPKRPIQRDISFSVRSYWAVLKVPYNRHQIVTTGFSFGTYFAIQTVLGKKYLQDFCGMDSIGAGYILMIMMFIAAFNSFLVAILSKCIGNRRLPFFRFAGFGSLSCAIILFGAVLFDCRSPWLSAVPMILLTFAGNNSSMSAAGLREMNGDARFGTCMSVSNFFAYLVTAAFGGCAGHLMDIFPPTIVNGVKIYCSESYLMIFAVLVVLGIICAYNSWRLVEPHNQK
ncbi:MAG: MFS transporter [Victivallales bacterium]|nr:MFS transporter [Victivallales bacterium]